MLTLGGRSPPSPLPPGPDTNGRPVDNSPDLFLRLPMNRNDAARVISTSGWLSRRPKEFQLEILRRSRLRRFEAGHFAILTTEHLDEAAAIFEQLMVGDPKARVATRLLTLAYHQGDTEKASLRVTQNELASMCALARQTINKVVKRFVRLGIVQSRYGRLTILDMDGLSSVAHSSDQ